MNQFTTSLLAYAIGVATFVKSLDWIYIFQIKEYRMDRFRSHLKEEGIGKSVFARAPRLPAKTIRNFLIVFCNSLLISTFILGLKKTSFSYLITALLLSPLIALCITTVAVLFTEIFAQIKRHSIIRKAKRQLARSKAVVIGITGSYGKTTTKEYLAHILSVKYKVAKTEENMNTKVGVALSILKNLSAGTEYLIVEIGAYRKGEIQSVCNLVHPTYGIVTVIGNQHLDLFGSKQKLIEAKRELLEALPPDGKGYVNKEIKDLELLTKNVSAPLALYSPCSRKTLIEQNLAPCIALANDLGLTQEEIKRALVSLPQPPHALTRHRGMNGALIIDDSNTSNVEGFIAAIRSLDQTKTSEKLILSKGIIELGKEKKSSYQRILDALDKTSCMLYTTDHLFSQLATKKNVLTFSTDADLFAAALTDITPTTAILVEGKFNKAFLDKIF